jgi:hypothetical protein
MFLPTMLALAQNVLDPSRQMLSSSAEEENGKRAVGDLPPYQ